jgi:branched-chain amino acid aminotransferase
MMKTEAKKVWMDGELVDFADARSHVLGHSLHYGVGVFEGIRAYETPRGTAIFRLKEHVARLLMSARFYFMQVPYSAAEIEQAIVDTTAANDIVPAYIRPLVYRGEPGLGVKKMTGKVSLAIGVIPATKYLGPGSEEGVKTKISPYRKPRSDAIPSYAKAAGNYLNSYLAGVDALKEGYEEAILLDALGHLAEGTGENIFLVRNRTLYTPGTESDILMGITRDSVIRIARDLDYEVIEKALSVNELYSADEAFFSGTFAEIVPIRSVGQYMIGDGKVGLVTRQIAEVFYRAVQGKEKRYAEWLTPVPKLVAPAIRARP